MTFRTLDEVIQEAQQPHDNSKLGQLRRKIHQDLATLEGPPAGWMAYYVHGVDKADLDNLSDELASDHWITEIKPAPWLVRQFFSFAVHTKAYRFRFRA